MVESTRRPELVVVVERTGDPERGRSLAGVLDDAGVPVRVHTTAPGLPLRAAASDALAALDLTEIFGPAGARTLIWLIPPGTLPQSDTLHHLVADWRRSPSVGAVGPKHVDLDDPSRLRSLGIHVTRSGRLVGRPQPGSPDQGQLDTASDILAVPLGGLLIEAELLERLGGWDPAFVDVAADLDLGWRAQRHGRRVLLAPRARMHSVPGVAVATADTPTRRRSARMVALTRVSPWMVLPLMVWIALTAVARAVALLLAKRPRAAAGELADLLAIRPLAIWRARRRTAHQAVVHTRDLRSLFVPGRSVVRRAADAVHDAVIPPRDPVGGEAHDLSPRSVLARALRHPVVVLPVLVLLATLAAARTLGRSAVSGLSDGFVGGELLGGRADAAALWASWHDGWRGAGLGGPSSGDPSLGVLAVLTWLVEKVPFVPEAHSPAGAALALALLLAMPTAAATAYAAGRVVTQDRLARSLVALAWAVNPVTVAAISQGRVGVALAAVVLPLVGAGTWLTGARRGTATSGFATGLALAVLGALAPVLMLLWAVVLAAILLVVPRARGRAAVALVTAAGLHAPWLLDVAAQPARALAGPGLVAWGASEISWGAVLPYAVPALLIAGLALVPGRSWRDVRTPLALVAVGSIAASLAAPAVTLGRSAGGEMLHPWAPVLLLPGIGALLAAALMLPQRPQWRSWPRWGLAAAAAGLVAGLVAPGLGTTLRPWQDPRPSVALDQSERFFATRTLVISLDGGLAEYQLVGKETSGLVRSLAEPAAADALVAPRVAGLLAGDASSVSLLSDAAVDVVAVRGVMAPALVTRFDTIPGLARMAAPTGWTFWRYAPVDAGATTVAPPRLAVHSPADRAVIAVAVGGQSARTATEIEVPSAGELVVAQPRDWADHATVRVDGTVVSPEAGAGPPRYAVASGLREIRIDIQPSHPLARPLSLAWLILVGFLAIPFGTRASRTGERS